ncbi:protein sidekick-like [Lineus longissimus]|uniref:protein sidekick-like n=1 Tax=Lineus longissimus TaxID=88925 RepID=UPI00315E00D8
MEVRCYQKIIWILTVLNFVIHSSQTDQEFPPTHFTENPVGSTVLEGTTQTLKCQANGKPSPLYSWYRNGQIFVKNTTDPSTKVYGIKLSEAGEYHCVAKNRLGAVLSRRVNVHVAYMNAFLTKIDRTIRVNQGDAVLVKLQPIDGYPTPEITWLEGDTPPPRNARYHETQNGDFVILESRLEDDNMILRAQADNLFTKTRVDSPATTVRIQHVGSAYSHIPPKFIVPPEDTIARIGDWSTSLECVINARPIEHLTIHWYKKRGRNRLLIESDFKYKVENYNRVLTIKHPGALDAGVYECEGTLMIPGGPQYTPVSLKAQLDVYSAPALVKESPTNMSKRTGDEVIIDCPVDAFPKPSVAWYKNGLALSVGLGTRFNVLENGSLRVESVDRDDAGVYQCFALNIAGEVDFVTALRITMRTKIALPPRNLNVLKGQTAILRCGVAHAYHIKIKVDWFHNKAPVRLHDPRIRILNDGTLRIFTIRSDESGNYTCKVHSVTGNDTRSAVIRVLSLPQSPTIDSVSISKDSDRKINIKWTPGSDGNSAIKYFIIQYRAVPRVRHGFMGVWEGWQPLASPKADTFTNNNFVYTAEDLIPGKTYQFHISTVNRIGEGRPSRASRTITLPPYDETDILESAVNGPRANQITNQKGYQPNPPKPSRILSTTSRKNTSLTVTTEKPKQELSNSLVLQSDQLKALMEVLTLSKEKLELEKEKLNIEMHVLRMKQRTMIENRRQGSISVNCFGHRKGEYLNDEGHDEDKGTS